MKLKLPLSALNQPSISFGTLFTQVKNSLRFLPRYTMQFPLSFYIIFLSVFAGGKVCAQNTQALPKVIIAGKPEIISIPKIAGGNRTISLKTGSQIIRLEPPKIVNLPVVTTPLKSSIVPDQFAAGHGSFTTYNSDNGLALDIISSSSMDHFGNLWFGTYGGGVSRYDGKSFVTYTTAQGLSSDVIFCSLTDKKGNLWFGTYGGVSIYDGKKFINYTTEQGLVGNVVRTIFEDKDGNIWLGTDANGVSRYDGKSFVTYTTENGLPSNVMRSIFQDKYGTLWFGTNGGVSRYDGKTFINYTTTQGLANNAVRSMLEDRTGNMWFGTNGGGVSKYDGKSFQNYTTAKGLADNEVRAILEDNNGDIWFATGAGLSRYNGTSFTNYSTLQGLPTNGVRNIVKDKAGNLWFGTESGGVSKYEGDAFINYTDALGLGSTVIWSMLEDKNGNLWFATNGGGMSKYDGKSFTNYTTAQGLVSNTIWGTFEDRAGNLWFGSQGSGVSVFDGKTFVNYTTSQGLPSNSIHCILEDSKGNFWIGTSEGASCFNGKSFTNYSISQGLSDNIIKAILEDKDGNLWFGTDDGLSRYDGKIFTNYTTVNGLASNIVSSIFEDRIGNLWIGTEKGLNYLSKKQLEGKNEQLFTTFTILDGLPDNYVTQIEELPNEKIVVGTNQGLAIFKPSIQLHKLQELGVFNTTTGFPVKDINSGPHSLLKDSKGIFWIATGSDKTGLVRFDYNAIRQNQKPPLVKIQNIKIDEENVCWEYLLNNLQAKKNVPIQIASDSLMQPFDSLSLLIPQFWAFGKSVPKNTLDNQQARFSDIRFDGITKFYPLPQNLVLPYNHNQISFEFAAIEPSRPGLMQYQYMLKGYDKTWSPVSDKTSVSFGHMDEGSYTFYLKAQGPDGKWCDPIVYTFKVLPPWWRTWWMYLSYVAIGVGFFLLALWWNGRRLRAKARELDMEVKKATAIISDQKAIVEERNERITDSINYAQRIQDAILPGSDFINSLFDDYFIYFQPKDIVSGDFYWVGEKDDKIIVAAVDCTGHGVPGALMSMIGNTLLNEIINEKGIVDSGEILNHLRNDVIRALKQSDAEGSQQDGMDIALCVWDRTKNSLQFSGAHNPLYHFRDGVLTVYKGERQHIGYVKGEFQPFEKISIEIQKGDTVYIFSDGFVDQRGEIEKRKFYSARFQKLLTSIQHEPMMKQKEILKNTFNEWKGNVDQFDDVLVLGIRL
jgi:ligand-binding sensor domain-containing protein/serine phosphatase RsbU (regulator of sigma subunit)